jgi:hypothetical protein
MSPCLDYHHLVVRTAREEELADELGGLALDNVLAAEAELVDIVERAGTNSLVLPAGKTVLDGAGSGVLESKAKQ